MNKPLFYQAAFALCHSSSGNIYPFPWCRIVIDSVIPVFTDFLYQIILRN